MGEVVALGGWLLAVEVEAVALELVAGSGR